MATHYIPRGEPVTISATTASTRTYATAAGYASYAVDNISTGNVVIVSVFPTTAAGGGAGVSSGNIVVLPGQTKVVASTNPLGAPANTTILTTTLTGISTVYLTPIVTSQG
jgi:hypothetical protein